MQRCCREEQQSLTAVLLLTSAHSDHTASPQLRKWALYNLCLIHPSDLLKCLQRGGRVIQQLRPDAFFMASAYSEHLSIPVTMCFWIDLANSAENIGKDVGISHLNVD